IKSTVLPAGIPPPSFSSSPPMPVRIRRIVSRGRVLINYFETLPNRLTRSRVPRGIFEIHEWYCLALRLSIVQVIETDESEPVIIPVEADPSCPTLTASPKLDNDGGTWTARSCLSQDVGVCVEVVPNDVGWVYAAWVHYPRSLELSETVG